ncbi:MAG: MBL fold metallo-hydrolase, partial [Acidimicrobiia bacterium]
MRLTFLCSNGNYTTPGRPASGYLVEHGDTRVWLDTGPGTFAALQQVTDPWELAAVLVSHQHADHCT